jgi:hypothetical protein
VGKRIAMAPIDRRVRSFQAQAPRSFPPYIPDLTDFRLHSGGRSVSKRGRPRLDAPHEHGIHARHLPPLADMPWAIARGVARAAAKPARKRELSVRHISCRLLAIAVNLGDLRSG